LSLSAVDLYFGISDNDIIMHIFIAPERKQMKKSSFFKLGFVVVLVLTVVGYFGLTRLNGRDAGVRDILRTFIYDVQESEVPREIAISIDNLRPVASNYVYDESGPLYLPNPGDSSLRRIKADDHHELFSRGSDIFELPENESTLELITVQGVVKSKDPDRLLIVVENIAEGGRRYTRIIDLSMRDVPVYLIKYTQIKDSAGQSATMIEEKEVSFSEITLGDFLRYHTQSDYSIREMIVLDRSFQGQF
jgi:hypothetical protein